MTEEDQDSSEKAANAPAKPEASSEPATSEPVATEPAATEESAAGEPVAAKKGKKGRRKKGAAASGAMGARSELDQNGRERPRFLLNFPRDPELEPVIAAFEAGNYARVRELAPRLLEHSADAEVKAAAQELLARIEPDPLVKFLLAVAVALFVVVVGLVYQSHG